MKTSPFIIVYQFICPICKKINAGTLTYEGIDAHNASRNIINHAPSCQFCSPLSPTTTTVRTFVFMPEPSQVDSA
jgi:hypothetical protein